MIALDYTVVIQIVAFLLLWFLLTRILFRPFLGLLEERERKTEGVKSEAASLMSEAERLRAEYEAGIATATDEGQALKRAIVEEALGARERLLAEAREETAKMLQRAREEIRKETERERQIAAGEARAIAREMGAKILGRGIG